MVLANTWPRWARSLAELFAIDVRALAAHRIGLGLMLIYDLLTRMPNAEAFYTDLGILPREVARQMFPEFSLSSFYFLTGETWGVLLFMSINLALLLCFTLGYRTRLMTVLSWIFLVSLHSRNEVVLHGGQHYLRIHMFWAMFLPLGLCWSLDAKGKPKHGCQRVVSAGTVAVLCQIIMLYVWAGFAKDGMPWVRDHSALQMAFSLSFFAMPLGEWLLHFPEMNRVMTVVSLWFERCGALLFLIPWRLPSLRLGLVVAFLAFHLGIALTIDMGTLTPMFALPLVLFLPSSFWDACQRSWAVRRVKVLPDSDLLVPAFRRHPWRHAWWSLVITGFFLWQFLENWQVLYPQPRVLPVALEKLGMVLRIEQDWRLFAPYPFVKHGWWVAKGTLADGKELDVYRPDLSPLSWERPENIRRRAGDSNWASYDIWIYQSYRQLAGNFARYLCHQWQQKYPSSSSPLTRVELFYMASRYDPVRGAGTPFVAEAILSQRCGDGKNSVAFGP